MLIICQNWLVGSASPQNELVSSFNLREILVTTVFILLPEHGQLGQKQLSFHQN